MAADLVTIGISALVGLPGTVIALWGLRTSIRSRRNNDRQLQMQTTRDQVQELVTLHTTKYQALEAQYDLLEAKYDVLQESNDNDRKDKAALMGHIRRCDEELVSLRKRVGYDTHDSPNEDFQPGNHPHRGR